MKSRLLPFIFLLLVISSRAQLIQGTLKSGSAPNEIEIWLKPDFTNSTQYLFQIGMPIAWPAAAVSQPTSLTVTLDPGFTGSFGSNYSVTVNPVAHNTANTENYFNIVLVRSGAGASTAQSWTAGTEFKVLTATFNPATAPGTQVKLADYQDGGSDGQGNFYTQDGLGNYYVTSNSAGNFYATGGQSVVGGNASAGFVQTTANVPLPVNLLRFNAFKNGSKNSLQWTTASEENNLGFEVQRSTDGLHYKPIGFVNTKAVNGNSYSEINYTFDDNTPEGKKQYYRIKQVDFDGRTKMSQVVLISGEKALNLSIGQIFPNPATDHVSIQINSPVIGKLQLRTIDMNGRLISMQIVAVGEGSNTIDRDVSKLTSGVYWIQATDENNNTVKSSFVKQ